MKNGALDQSFVNRYLEQLSGNENRVRLQVVYISVKAPQSGESTTLQYCCEVSGKHDLTPEGGDGHGTLGNHSIVARDGTVLITATGLEREITQNSFVKVLGVIEHKGEFTVVVAGERPPSSEALLHFIVYALLPHIRSVQHGHNDVLTTNSAGLYVTTRTDKVGSKSLIESVVQAIIHLSAQTTDSEATVALGELIPAVMILRDHGYLAFGTTEYSTLSESFTAYRNALQIRIIQLFQNASPKAQNDMRDIAFGTLPFSDIRRHRIRQSRFVRLNSDQREIDRELSTLLPKLRELLTELSELQTLTNHEQENHAKVSAAKQRNSKGATA